MPKSIKKKKVSVVNFVYNVNRKNLSLLNKKAFNSIKTGKSIAQNSHLQMA
ncbi:hypothetical protein GCM10009865_44820 [Aeromicrobium ponti]